jgi:uncharacterized protein
MNKPRKIHIGTFLVPLAGVALYYCAQFAAAAFTTVIYPENGTNSLISERAGTLTVLIAVITCAFIALWLASSGKPMRDLVRRQKPEAVQFLAAIPIALGMLGFVNLFFIWISWLAPRFSVIQNLYESYQSNMDELSPLGGTETVLYILGISLLIPITEELIFRGIILGKFLESMKPGLAVFLSALIFACMHIEPLQVVYAFISGLILGYAYLYSNSIFISITIHAIFNFLGGALTLIVSSEEKWLNSLAYIELASTFLLIICILYLRASYVKRNAKAG